MDTGATAYLHFDTSTLNYFSNKCIKSNFSVLIGDDTRLLATKIGHFTLRLNPFRTRIPVTKKRHYYTLNH